MKVRRVIATLAGTVVGVAASVAAFPAQAQETSMVSILHAVPDATVDVYGNGEALVTDFQPGTLTDPVKLPADTYDLKVVAAGDGPDGDAVIEANGVAVPGGANITVVAHLGPEGEPILTPFVNDTSQLAPGKARVTVRHTAAAPEVDVRADEKSIFEGLTNPKEAKADVEAGRVSADVTLAGSDDIVIGPADLDLAEGANTIVYAWGSADDENLDLAVQTISGLHGDPSGVPGGTGGQAATVASAPVAVGAALLVLGLTGLALVGSRRSAFAAGDRRR